MSNMSVADILKLHGKWIAAENFAKLVASRLERHERTAYRKIKKAVRKKEILRITVSDRTVLYGLAEFGPPIDKKKNAKPLSKAEIEAKERRANFYADAKWVGEAYPSMKPLSDYADLIKKFRKELGLDP